MYWGAFPGLLALLQYAEAGAASGNAERFDRTTAAMVAHLRATLRQMQTGPTFCQTCGSGAWAYPCWGSGLPLPSNGSCHWGLDLCGGDIDRAGVLLPAGATPAGCADLCRQHNAAAAKEHAPACAAFVLGVGNASAYVRTSTSAIRCSVLCVHALPDPLGAACLDE